MQCPKCGFTQPEAASCARCGIVVARFRPRSSGESSEEAASQRDEDLVDSHMLERFLTASRRLTVEQRVRHWWEILVDWEQRNEYSISGDGAGLLGSMVEQRRGLGAIVGRMILGSHRPLEVVVFGAGDRVLLEITRPFYWVTSSLSVRTAAGRLFGRVQSRLALLHRHYDLYDDSGRVFATIRSPRWRPWTFPILDASGAQAAVITKSWAGLLREYYTDADNFGLDFGTHEWTLPQRAVLVAAMISIDYDYFENNEGSRR